MKDIIVGLVVFSAFDDHTGGAREGLAHVPGSHLCHHGALSMGCVVYDITVG